MTTGTNHFTSRAAAREYYSAQDPDLSEKELREWVEEKIQVGEIEIGPPHVKGKGNLVVKDGRYCISF